MKLAELERHLRHHGCALYREGAAIAFGSTLRPTRSPASRAIAKSRKGLCEPSANNWKFRADKTDNKTPSYKEGTWGTQLREREDAAYTLGPT